MKSDVIDFFSIAQEFKTYELKNLKKDALAALSVALLALPQAIAYAFVAHLPTAAGIFSAIFGTIFTASFGTSRSLVSGPTNTIAILLQWGVSEILFTYYRSTIGVEREVLAMGIVMQLVLLVGIFQIMIGLFKLGRLTRFASQSVIVGYVLGAAVLIAITQLYPFFGIERLTDAHPAYQQIWHLFSHLYSLNTITTIIAVCSLVILIFFRRFSKKIPSAAIVLLLATLVVAGFRFTQVARVSDIGPIVSDLPKIAWPYFDMRIMTKALPLAFAIALLGILEAIAVGRTYHSVKKAPYQENQEIYGLGISNFCCSFLGAMPASGSFSRSSLNREAGAKTRFAAIFSGFLVLLFILLFGFFIRRIPLCSLSALMLITAYGMVNFKHLALCLHATKADALVVVVTFASSLLFSLEIALYVGIVLSICFYLKQTAVPLVIEYGFNNIGKLRPLEEEGDRDDPNIAIVQAEGELYFASAAPLASRLHLIADDENLSVIILQLMNTRSIDATVCMALKGFNRFLKATDRVLILSGVSSQVAKVMRQAELDKEIGQEYIFGANEQLPGEPTRQAYNLAKQLVFYDA